MAGPRALVAGVVLAIVLALGACGGSDAPSPVSLPPEEYGHIHGLGVNPADDSLLIATHTGLFRAASGAGEAARVAESHRDTMGFTVVTTNTFLASGHPDAREDEPPHLGLIVSEDAGASWRELSLGGQADLHVIRVGSRLTYAFDSLSGSLLVSDDAADTWKVGQPPRPLLDFVLDPRDERHLIGATEHGLYRSRDRGADWRRIRRGPSGFLTWSRAEPRRLMVVAPDGTVHRSADAGRSWRRVGGIAGEPTATTSHDADVYVATTDGTVRVSKDAGRSWTVRVERPS